MCTLLSWLPWRATEAQFLWKVWEVGWNTFKLPPLSAETAYIFTKSPSMTGGRLHPEILILWHFWLTLPKGQVCSKPEQPLRQRVSLSKVNNLWDLEVSADYVRFLSSLPLLQNVNFSGMWQCWFSPFVHLYPNTYNIAHTDITFCIWFLWKFCAMFNGVCKY